MPVQRGVTCPNKQGWVYQGHVWHNGITRGYDMITCLSNG
jgi:hypothetical protein